MKGRMFIYVAAVAALVFGTALPANAHASALTVDSVTQEKNLNLRLTGTITCTAGERAYGVILVVQPEFTNPTGKATGHLVSMTCTGVPQPWQEIVTPVKGVFVNGTLRYSITVKTMIPGGLPSHSTKRFINSVTLGT